MQDRWGDDVPRFYLADIQGDEVIVVDVADNYHYYGFPFSINGDKPEIDFACGGKRKKFVYEDYEDGSVQTGAFEFGEHISKIEEADINAISSILNYDNLNSYNGLADKDKTELGYRDGWRTEYKVYYCNGQCLSGKLSIIFEESPLEQTIRLLREKYPYIEVVQHI